MVLVGSVTLGQAGPSMEALASARGVAYTVFKLIDRVRLYCLFIIDTSNIVKLGFH